MRKEWIIALAGLAACAAILTGGCRSPVAPPTTRLSADADTVGLWHFNEGSGQYAYDSSTTGWDLFLGDDADVESEDPTWTADGMFGGGLSFSAAETEYLTAPGQTVFFTAQQITVEFWIKTTSTGNSFPISSANICFYAQLDNAGIMIAAVGDGVDWSYLTPSQTAVNDGQWHYIAITYDATLNGGTLSMYVDGNLENDDGGQGITLANPDYWHVGGRPSLACVTGAIDEVRVSKSARTASEIAANY